MTDDARIAQIREQMGTRLPNGTLCIIRTRKNAAEYDLLDAYDACQSALAAMKAERDKQAKTISALEDVIAIYGEDIDHFREQRDRAHEAGAVWMREKCRALADDFHWQLPLFSDKEI